MKRPKRRNPIARQLRAPLYRKRTVRNRKVYSRKKRVADRHEAEDSSPPDPPAPKRHGQDQGTGDANR